MTYEFKNHICLRKKQKKRLEIKQYLLAEKVGTVTKPISAQHETEPRSTLYEYIILVINLFVPAIFTWYKLLKLYLLSSYAK